MAETIARELWCRVVKLSSHFLWYFWHFNKLNIKHDIKHFDCFSISNIQPHLFLSLDFSIFSNNSTVQIWVDQTFAWIKFSDAFWRMFHSSRGRFNDETFNWFENFWNLISNNKQRIIPCINFFNPYWLKELDRRKILDLLQRFGNLKHPVITLKLLKLMSCLNNCDLFEVWTIINIPKYLKPLKTDKVLSQWKFQSILNMTQRISFNNNSISNTILGAVINLVSFV